MIAGSSLTNAGRLAASPLGNFVSMATTDGGVDLSTIQPSAEPEQSLQWLSELLAERLQTLNEAEVQSMAPKQLADHLAFEIGQTTLWVHSFALALLPRECESYFAAPPAAVPDRAPESAGCAMRVLSGSRG